MSGVELFRPAPNTSCQLPSLPGYRSGHTLDGLVLCGGQDRAGDEGSRSFHDHDEGMCKGLLLVESPISAFTFKTL